MDRPVDVDSFQFVHRVRLTVGLWSSGHRAHWLIYFHIPNFFRLPIIPQLFLGATLFEVGAIV